MLLNFICLILIMLNVGGKDVLWTDTFDYPDGALPSVYWSEGCEGVIRNGRLYIDADTVGSRASTVWLNKEFSGDIHVEFDVQVVSSSDTANNINLFFMYSDPSGKSLRQSAPERQSGTYSLYHQLNGYIFTNVTNGNETKVRYRFRDNPGFKLLDEAFTGENRVGETHHIKIIKKANRFQYWVDGEKILDTVDDKHNPLYEHGIIGLRTWHTALSFDNLTVERLKECR
ncbi:MAG: DUF1961 family protein [Prolixibacteraceae bacterium]